MAGFQLLYSRLRIAIGLGIVALSTAGMAHADGLDGWGMLVDTGYSHDNNLTHASNAADKRADNALNLSLDVNKSIMLSEHTRLVLSGFLDSKTFQSYGGLDRLSVDGEAEFMYRTSGEFSAPTFGLVGSVGRDEYKSDVRKNNHYATGLTLRQPVTDRINLYAALKHNISHSDNDIFDTRDTSTQLNLDYGFGNGNTLYLTSEYHLGDIISSVLPSASYWENALPWVTDDVFTSGQQALYDYRLWGKTAVVTLGCNLPLAGKKSIDISWRYVRSTAEIPTDDGNASIKYVGSQFAIDYLLSF